MDLNMLWFILLGVLLAGYAILDGFDLGVGILQPVARTDDRAASYPQLHRADLGRQRSLAGHVRRRDVRRLPRIVRHGLLGLLHRVHAGAVRAHPAGCVDRVPRQAGLARLAQLLGLRLLRGQPAGLAAVRRRRWRGHGGVPLDERGIFVGSFFDQLTPYSLVVGLMTVAMFTMHGAIYLYLKTEGALPRPHLCAGCGAASASSSSPTYWSRS